MSEYKGPKGKAQRLYEARLTSCRDYYRNSEKTDIAETIRGITHCSQDDALHVAEETTERWQEGDLWK